MRARRSRPREPQDRGAALILVVWAVGLMAVMAAMVARDAHLDARESRMARESLSARLLAESGVRLALERLDSPAGAAPDAFPFVCDLPDGRIIADVRPVSALVDLNAAQEEMLAALFLALGFDEREAAGAAARIADFRDADGTARPGGAEVAEYRRAGLAHGPANRPFNRNGELSEVLGITPRMLEKVLPHLTVHSYSTRIDPTHAAPVVLRALDIFGAEAVPDIDDGGWDFGARSGPSRIGAGAVVVHVIARTPAGQPSSIRATYGALSVQALSSRPLVETHAAGGTLSLAAGARLPQPRPCF